MYQPEDFTLTLLLGGRYAGEQHWQVGPEKGSEKSMVVARVQTDFGGVLPPIRRVQQSKMHPLTLHSGAYHEGDGRGRANFETLFDSGSGLIYLRQGRDEASAPLTVEHHDPVSLLLWLRFLDAEAREKPQLTAQLTGGRALIQRLPDTELEVRLKESAEQVACYTYFLRPGGAYVYLEQAAPHRLIRLIQPTDFGPVEAHLGLSAGMTGRGRATEPRQRRRSRGA